jgi:hypothetical protein
MSRQFARSAAVPVDWGRVRARAARLTINLKGNTPISLPRDALGHTAKRNAFRAVCRDWCCLRELTCSAPCRVRLRSGCLSAKPKRDMGINLLVALSGYTGQRAACRERCDAEWTRLTCYSGAGFDPELADRAAGVPLIRLVGPEGLYG